MKVILNFFFPFIYHYIDFDWEGVTSRPAPIIPDCQIDLRSVGLENNPFNDSEYKKKRGSFTSTGRKKFFNMTRTELLHKITLQKVQTPQK